MTRRTTRADIPRELRDTGILAVIPSGALKVYLMFLAECSGSDPSRENYRRSWFGQKRVSRELGYSRKTINECRMELERLGIITVRQHQRGRPLLNLEIVDRSTLHEIADWIKEHGIPPGKKKNSYPQSGIAGRTRVNPELHAASEPEVTRTGEPGVTRASESDVTQTCEPEVTPEPKKEPSKKPLEINRGHPLGEPEKKSYSNGKKTPASPKENDWPRIWEEVKQDFLTTTKRSLSPVAAESHFVEWYRDARGITYDGLSFTIEARDPFNPAWLTNEIGYALGQAFNAYGLEIPSFCVVDPTGQALTRTPQQIQQDNALTKPPPPPPPPPPPAKLCDCGQMIPPDKADERDKCQECWDQEHKPTERQQPKRPKWTPNIPPRQAPNQSQDELSLFDRARTEHIDYRQASIRNREGPPAKPQ